MHLIGPPGTGKSHLSLALGVEAVKAGRSVYFGSLADIVATLAKAEKEGSLREKIRFRSPKTGKTENETLPTTIVTLKALIFGARSERLSGLSAEQLALDLLDGEAEEARKAGAVNDDVPLAKARSHQPNAQVHIIKRRPGDERPS